MKYCINVNLCFLDYEICSIFFDILVYLNFINIIICLFIINNGLK